LREASWASFPCFHQELFFFLFFLRACFPSDSVFHILDTVSIMSFRWTIRKILSANLHYRRFSKVECLGW
jgi:hypothetical protein